MGVIISIVIIKASIDMLKETLDSIIKDVSGGVYTNTADFQRKFIQGTYKNGDYEGDEGSLDFCTSFLNYLESQSTEGDWTDLAHGSVLKQDQQYTTPLDPDSTAVSDLYVIHDSGNFVASTVDDDFAWNTGGTSDVGGMNKTANDYESINDDTEASAEYDQASAEYGEVAGPEEGSIELTASNEQDTQEYTKESFPVISQDDTLNNTFDTGTDCYMEEHPEENMDEDGGEDCGDDTEDKEDDHTEEACVALTE